MPQPKSDRLANTKQPQTTDKPQSLRQWYSVPEPIRRVFDEFPITCYEKDELPQRAKHESNRHTLYVFDNPFDESGREMSCNPTCLKWQSYLKFNDIDFATKPSNNHASPSGSLPFLIPAKKSNEIASTTLIPGKLPRWVSQQVMQEEEIVSTAQEAYIILVEQNIRDAWLYHLYLERSNFEKVAHPLYVRAASSNRFVQLSIAQSLREAAQKELLKSRPIIDKDEVYTSAEKAFTALSTLLGSALYFSGAESPGLFDANVFAYTHLLLDESLPWGNKTLPDMLQSHPQLIKHWERLLKIYLNA